MDILIPKKNVIFDATLLTAAQTCGQFLDLRFNNQLGSKEGKSNSLEIGSIVHKGLEIYYKSRMKGMDHKASIAHGLAGAEMYIKGCQYCTDFQPTDDDPKPKCGHPINEYPGVKNTPPESQSKPYVIVGWQWVLETLLQYWDKYKADSWVPLQVEHVERKQIYEDDEIRVLWKGKLDLVVDTNSGIYPMDHKTMKQNRPSLSLNNQFKGQCFLMDTKLVWINKVGFQTTLKPEEKFKRVPINYSTDQLLEWQEQIVPYWAYQLLSWSESGYYPHQYSSCEGKFGPCMFNEVCGADRNMRVDIIRNDFVVQPKWDIENVED